MIIMPFKDFTAEGLVRIQKKARKIDYGLSNEDLIFLIDVIRMIRESIDDIESKLEM